MIGAKVSPNVSQDNEDGALKGHSERRHKNPVLTVDGILVTNGRLLLVRRGREPEKGKLALPGGIVEYGETTEEAVVREVREETGIGTRASEPFTEESTREICQNTRNKSWLLSRPRILPSLNSIRPWKKYSNHLKSYSRSTQNTGQHEFSSVWWSRSV